MKIPRRRTLLVILCFGAVQLQAAEDPLVMEGLPEHLIYIYTQEHADSSPPESAVRQLYASTRRWEPGRVLRVCMFGGNPIVASLVRTIAGEWNGTSSIRFDFGPQPGGYNCLSPSAGFFQVRVGFSTRGYWSVLGIDSERLLDPMVPSMNLEGFNRMYSETRYSPQNVVTAADAYHKAVIRHEFGHALGLLHEHQNTALNCFEQIRWTGPDNVYEYFARPPNGWDVPQVNRNLGFIGQTDPDYVAGDPDPASIMMYALPAAIFSTGASSQCVVPVNYSISGKDRAIVAKMYPALPPSGPAITETTLSSNLRPLPTNVPEAARADLLSRTLVDLESNDAYTRRDARARLADLLDSGTSAVQLTDLISRMKSGSYRYKLGVSVALANSKAADRLQAADRANLGDVATATSDPTLQRNIKQVL
jgi:hypothetical protein